MSTLTEQREPVCEVVLFCRVRNGSKHGSIVVAHAVKAERPVAERCRGERHDLGAPDVRQAAKGAETTAPFTPSPGMIPASCPRSRKG